MKVSHKTQNTTNVKTKQQYRLQYCIKNNAQSDIKQVFKYTEYLVFNFDDR